MEINQAGAVAGELTAAANKRSFRTTSA